MNYEIFEINAQGEYIPDIKLTSIEVEWTSKSNYFVAIRYNDRYYIGRCDNDYSYCPVIIYDRYVMKDGKLSEDFKYILREINLNKVLNE